MHLDPLDFSALRDALNIQAWSAEIVNATVDRMTTEVAQLAVSSNLNLNSSQDYVQNSIGDMLDAYA